MVGRMSIKLFLLFLALNPHPIASLGSHLENEGSKRSWKYTKDGAVKIIKIPDVPGSGNGGHRAIGLIMIRMWPKDNLDVQNGKLHCLKQDHDGIDLNTMYEKNFHPVMFTGDHPNAAGQMLYTALVILEGESHAKEAVNSYFDSMHGALGIKQSGPDTFRTHLTDSSDYMFDASEKATAGSALQKALNSDEEPLPFEVFPDCQLNFWTKQQLSVDKPAASFTIAEMLMNKHGAMTHSIRHMAELPSKVTNDCAEFMAANEPDTSADTSDGTFNTTDGWDDAGQNQHSGPDINHMIDHMRMNDALSSAGLETSGAYFSVGTAKQHRPSSMMEVYLGGPHHTPDVSSPEERKLHKDISSAMQSMSESAHQHTVAALKPYIIHEIADKTNFLFIIFCIIAIFCIIIPFMVCPAIAAVVGPLAEPCIQLVIVPVLSTVVQKALSPMVIKAIAQIMIMTLNIVLGMKMAMTLTMCLADAIGADVTESVTKSIITAVIGFVNLAVNNRVPGELIHEVTWTVSANVIHRVSHSLLHGLTHGVTHTVTHKVIHHWYCIYCYYYGNYCDYCYYYEDYTYMHSLWGFGLPLEHKQHPFESEAKVTQQYEVAHIKQAVGPA